jgi:uncharacterized SAM-binding protein YcdF (DUF218 family)
LFWLSGVLVGALIVHSVFFSRQFFSSISVDLAEIEQVELIVVLTGGRGRMREAVELLKAEKSERLLISGMRVGTSLEEVFKANQLGQLTPRLREQIIPGMASSSTYENAKEIREAIEKYNPKSVLLITSNYHLPRARDLLMEELQRSYFRRWPQLMFYGIESPNFGPKWYLSLNSWFIYLSEYFKSLFSL